MAGIADYLQLYMQQKALEDREADRAQERSLAMWQTRQGQEQQTAIAKMNILNQQITDLREDSQSLVTKIEEGTGALYPIDTTKGMTDITNALVSGNLGIAEFLGNKLNVEQKKYDKLTKEIGEINKYRTEEKSLFQKFPDLAGKDMDFNTKSEWDSVYENLEKNKDGSLTYGGKTYKNINDWRTDKDWAYNPKGKAAIFASQIPLFNATEQREIQKFDMEQQQHEMNVDLTEEALIGKRIENFNLKKAVYDDQIVTAMGAIMHNIGVTAYDKKGVGTRYSIGSIADTYKIFIDPESTSGNKKDAKKALEAIQSQLRKMLDPDKADKLYSAFIEYSSGTNNATIEAAVFNILTNSNISDDNPGLRQVFIENASVTDGVNFDHYIDVWQKRQAQAISFDPLTGMMNQKDYKEALSSGEELKMDLLNQTIEDRKTFLDKLNADAINGVEMNNGQIVNLRDKTVLDINLKPMTMTPKTYNDYVRRLFSEGKLPEGEDINTKNADGTFKYKMLTAGEMDVSIDNMHGEEAQSWEELTGREGGLTAKQQDRLFYGFTGWSGNIAMDIAGFAFPGTIDERSVIDSSAVKNVDYDAHEAAIREAYNKGVIGDYVPDKLIINRLGDILGPTDFRASVEFELANAVIAEMSGVLGSMPQNFRDFGGELSSFFGITGATDVPSKSTQVDGIDSPKLSEKQRTVIRAQAAKITKGYIETGNKFIQGIEDPYIRKQLVEKNKTKGKSGWKQTKEFLATDPKVKRGVKKVKDFSLQAIDKTEALFHELGTPDVQTDKQYASDLDKEHQEMYNEMFNKLTPTTTPDVAPETIPKTTKWYGMKESQAAKKIDMEAEESLLDQNLILETLGYEVDFDQDNLQGKPKRMQESVAYILPLLDRLQSGPLGNQRSTPDDFLSLLSSDDRDLRKAHPGEWKNLKKLKRLLRRLSREGEIRGWNEGRQE